MHVMFLFDRWMIIIISYLGGGYQFEICFYFHPYLNGEYLTNIFRRVEPTNQLYN